MSYAENVEAVYRAQLVAPEAEWGRLKEELVGCIDDAGVSGASTEWSDAEIANFLVSADAPADAWTCREVWLARTGQ